MKKVGQPSGLATRKRLLRAAAQVFLEKGYEGATAKEIAERAEISTGAPFLPFGNKEGVLLELVKRMFLRQYTAAGELVSAVKDPLLLYGIETGIQMYIVEQSETLRELYVAAYSLPSTSSFIYGQMAERLEKAFADYLPRLERKDFYELELASAGITRSFMAEPCDLYFTMSRKLRRYLSCCFKIYEVPRETYLPVINRVLELKPDLARIAAELPGQMLASIERSLEGEIAV